MAHFGILSVYTYIRYFFYDETRNKRNWLNKIKWRSRDVRKANNLIIIQKKRVKTKKVNVAKMSHLTHRTKSPTIVVESRTRKTPPSLSFINKSVASCRDIGPKYQLKENF